MAVSPPAPTACKGCRTTPSSKAIRRPDPPMSQRPTYIFNAKLIDGSGDDKGDRPYAALISGGRIASVEPQQNVAQPDGAIALDARGCTLMPGMMDCHEHMATMPGGMRERANIPQSL